MTASGTMAIERLRTLCEEIHAQTQHRPPCGVRYDDADGDIGTFASDDAIGFDPFPMLAVMQSTKANYAVFGQVASILHGSSEPTGDLDILWDGSADAVDRLASELDGAGVVLRDQAFTVALGRARLRARDDPCPRCRDGIRTKVDSGCSCLFSQ